MCMSPLLEMDGEAETKDEDEVEGISAAAKWQPWQWIWGMAREVNSSFVLAMIVVCGVSQGFGGALNGLVVEYYWKDVQGAAPWQVQFYSGIVSLPWNVKPLYGILTDAFPVAGYRRRPYFILPGLLSIASAVAVSLSGKVEAFTAVGLLTAGSLAAAVIDVTMDAEVARKIRDHPGLAPEIQSFSSSCSAVGGLVGFVSSGMIVHAFGSQAAMCLLGIPSMMVVMLGFIFDEGSLPSHSSKLVWENIREVAGKMWCTLRRPQVWRPTVYMFLSWALCPRISKAKFYWFTDTTVGPGFSQQFMGMIYAMGSVGTLCAAIVYRKVLRQYSFRSMLKWTQILLAASGMLDLLLILRVNLKLHLPDAFLVIVDESLTGVLYRLKWVPILVMCAKLCPSGIEGSLFALLMSVDNLGIFSAQWSGGILLKLCNVVRADTPTGLGETNFQQLWLAVLLRNLMLLLPLPFLFLVPDTGPNVDILPPGSLLSAEPISVNNEPLLQKDS